MKIDWFTFFAQVVNFLILVALLRWLLYGRVVRAMQQREEAIANRFRDADRKQQEAAETIQQYDAKSDQLEQEREAVLHETRQAAQEEFQRLLAEARQDVDRQLHQWQEESRRQREDLLAELRHTAAQMGLEAARRTLALLAGEELEGRMCDAFAARIRDVEHEQRQEIARHLENAETDVVVRSVFPMPEQQQKRLRELIRQAFGYEAEVGFERSSELICGLELDVGGYSFGWNAKHAFQKLEGEFEERLRSI